MTAAASWSASGVRDSLTVSAWTFVSRLSGVLRVAITAAVLGPTYFGNTYQTTNSLPNTIYYGLLGGSLLSSILVPTLVGHLDLGDRGSSGRVVGGFLGLIWGGLAVLLPLAFLAAPVLLHLAAPAGPGAADQQHVAQVFLLLLLPQVFLYALIGCSSAVMHSQRRFALAAAAPALENIGAVVTLAVAALLYGSGRELGTVPRGEVLVLGAGTTMAVGLHASVQWWGARRAGAVIRPRAGWQDPEVARLVRRSLVPLLQAATNAVQVLAVLFVCNRVAGGVVAYQIASNFYFLPIALGAAPVALSLLPRLSRLVGAGREQPFRDAVVGGLRFASFLTLPAAVVMVVLAPALARLVSFGAMSGSSGTGLVSDTLAVLALGIVGETFFMVATYASYARGDMSAPFRSMLVKAGTCALGLACVVLWAPDRDTVVAAGLVVALAAAAGAAHRVRHLLRALPSSSSEPLVRALGPLGLGAVAMIVPLYVGRRVLGPVSPRPLLLVGVLVVLGLSAAVFLAVQAALGAPEVRSLRVALRPRSSDTSGAEELVAPARPAAS